MIQTLFWHHEKRLEVSSSEQHTIETAIAKGLDLATIATRFSIPMKKVRAVWNRMEQYNKETC